MRRTDSIEKLVKKLRYQASAEARDRILGNVLGAVDGFEKRKSGTVAPNIRRTIMKGRIPKLAAAAVIVIAVLVGLPFFRGNGSGIALADVLERIEHAQAFVYKMKMTMTASMKPDMPAVEQQMEGTVIISTEYGMKMILEITDPNGKKHTSQSYVLQESKQMISVLPEMKKYMLMEFDDDLFAKAARENNDPRYVVKQIMSSEYEELGRSEIDGLEVEGFETTNSPLFGGSGTKVTLWVDAENWFPVRMEMDLKDEHNQATGVAYGYQWDIAIEPEEFQPVIPEDFTAFTEKPIRAPSGDEQGAIEGLKFFADILGRYPKNLDTMGLMKEFSAIEHSQNLTEAGQKFKERMNALEKDEEKFMGEFMEIMRPVQSLSMFYMRLVQGKKEPVYYGESVGPNDADAVLLRWQISESQYRVLFGDLTAANVTAEELAELEKPLLP